MDQVIKIALVIEFGGIDGPDSLTFLVLDHHDHHYHHNTINVEYSIRHPRYTKQSLLSSSRESNSHQDLKKTGR